MDEEQPIALAKALEWARNPPTLDDFKANDPQFGSGIFGQGSPVLSQGAPTEPYSWAGVRSPTDFAGGGAATTAQPDRCDYVQLPQNPRGGGYYNYGTPGHGAGQYGRPDTISLIQAVGRNWQDAPFGVGNMSLNGGGMFPPHKSHQDGYSIDVRPVRTDNSQVGSTTWRSPSYDRARTQKLVDDFRASGRVKAIWFNDPAIKGVTPMSHHDDHFHVELKPSCKRR